MLNSVPLIILRVGNDIMNPMKTEGSTNIILCRIIIVISPLLLRPTILITPNSNVLVSTLIIRSE